MKKKLIILALIIAAVAMPAMAGEVGTDPGAGKVKLGGILGNGLNVTAGFDSGGMTEWNVVAGADWGFDFFYAGVNLMFTLVDIDIAGEIFPLSLGPHVNLGYQIVPDYWWIENDDTIRIEVLANVRWEYTFDFPLNLFAEVGMGLGLRFSDYYSSPAFFAYQAGVGVRYVFGM